MFSRTQLLSLGFADSQQATEAVARLGLSAPELLPMIGRTAEPQRALDGLLALLDIAPDAQELLATLAADQATAMRILSVLGASEALGAHLLRHPAHWRELVGEEQAVTRPTAAAMRAGLVAAVRGKDPVAGADALRVEYRRQLLRLAARDLADDLALDDAAAELSDLAAGTLEAALVLARAKVGEASEGCRLAVVAMGKCGGHELNYVSDVDVLFIAQAVEGHSEQAALKAATRVASTMMQICSDQTAEGTIWPVDPNLRPEGRSGPLVRTLASYCGYYERWAKTWEFQALLKARPVAGDIDLGNDFIEMTNPMVWTAVERDGFVEEVQAMRRRVLDNIPADEMSRQLKLGPGGLRDVEFAVQLLQMVHGRTDEKVRPPTTLSALARLTEGGYVGRADGQSLHEAYSFLRTMEHRIQMFQLRRTHVVPSDEESLRRLGRSMGFLRDPVAELDRQWAHHRREVRRLHERLFYRPLLTAVARISSDEARLSPGAAKERLAALGYLDPAAALRHLEELTAGVSRTAAIQRTLLPAMLGWFADAPDPDAGLLGFRWISETLGATHWYLRLLRDEGEAAHRMARMLATSRYATDLLRREPEGVALLGEEGLAPLSGELIAREMHATAARRKDAQDAVVAIRAIRRRELLRISVVDLCESEDITVIAGALTDLTTASLDAALAAVTRGVELERGVGFPARMALVAMGRYGGHELGYGSDADLMYVYDPIGDPQVAASMAKEITTRLAQLLAVPGSDPALEIDASLRPEGRQGPMVRTLASYAAYYAKWSQVWEAQALLRADPLIGDPGLRAAFSQLIDPLRYPDSGLEAKEVTEIRRIKARVDEERLPRGADPATHFKLGRGGLSDIEWTIQLLQMQYAGQYPKLQTTKTLDALAAAVEAELIDAEDAAQLGEAWRLASRARNATVQVRGKPSDQLPRDARERAAVATILGYGPGSTDEMLNDYLRTARQARGVVDKIFWGD
ncbi:MAG: bifunctional [glutamine synthetase] adenylyltransferase/[glutamine synthetase]-adenylyl-L-tyrosine phosphorylase [Nocardioidaceae bacterium]|nr:bifunctional [glutamine synthetase] adenylyltransferase/[glutamine synthetase]-adenylyl-L-tyrosine phosphorylase [Nocardioidaceae bacterium]